MQPGDTISPKDDKGQELKPSEEISLPEPVTQVDSSQTEPADTPTPGPEPDEQPDSPREPNEPDAPETAWQYRPADDDASAAALPPPSIAAVSWTASEYIEHEKPSSWFVMLFIIAVASSVLLFLLTHEVLMSIIIFIVAALFGVTAARKPRTLNYELNPSGVTIAEKHYPYNLFKSFSVLDEGAFSSVMLMPLKRFMPTLSLYYPPEQENNVLQTLASYLPHEERTHDPIDRLMRRVRF